MFNRSIRIPFHTRHKNYPAASAAALHAARIKPLFVVRLSKQVFFRNKPSTLELIPTASRKLGGRLKKTGRQI